MYSKIENDSFSNKHHMASNSILYNIEGAGKLPMFINMFPDIPEYVEGEKSYIVKDTEKFRLDNIAYKYYGTPELLWVIMLANNIIDPFNIKENTVIRILPLSYIEYNMLRYNEL
jgi:nucleoid-associated protein YgaU